MFHFHGHEPARKEWVQAMDGAVFVALTLGIGSGPYEAAFREPGAFERLVESVERPSRREVRKRARPASSGSAPGARATAPCRKSCARRTAASASTR